MNEQQLMTSTFDSEQPDIVKYTDYVPYINDLVKHMRKTGHFSFRSFCKKSGFKSPTYLKWVMDEVRPISTKSVDRFADGLELGKREARYLQLLVNYKEAKDPNKKKVYFEEILTRQERNNKDQPYVKERYQYLSHWYYVTIRELVAHPDFNDDPHWIQKKLGNTVTIWEVKNAMKTLERLGLISKDEAGKWHQQDQELNMGVEVESMAAFNYHSEVLKISRDILMQTSHEVRDFSSVVSLIDKDTFHALRQKMRDFQDEVINFLSEKEKLQSEQSSKVMRELYMLNMQLLPFTEFDDREFLDKPKNNS
jgi:uncharacterized protein (TIGR02147 family)